jgi:hypothetical protein
VPPGERVQVFDSAPTLRTYKKGCPTGGNKRCRHPIQLLRPLADPFLIE